MSSEAIFESSSKVEPAFPLNKIIKRLEILKNYIILEDIEELHKEGLKLKPYDFNSDLSEIIEEIKHEEFASAIIKIQNFISKNQQLSVWVDPEVKALELEIKNLKDQLTDLNNEKIELEKLLSNFQHRHTIELGVIILEILRLRKLKFKVDKKKYEEALNDEKEYQQQVNLQKKRQIFKLTENQQTELKKNFRKATVLCHPDKVSNEFKDVAQKIFIELKHAYDHNNLKKVNDILNNLEKGILFIPKSEIIQEKDLLKAVIVQLKIQIEVLTSEIMIISQSSSYKTIASINDWDEYFSKTKEKLQRELAELRSKFQQ